MGDFLAEIHDLEYR
jgi:hypothetical protein